MPIAGAIHCGDAAMGFFAEPGPPKVQQSVEEILKSIRELSEKYNERAAPEKQLTGHIIQVAHRMPFTACLNSTDPEQCAQFYKERKIRESITETTPFPPRTPSTIQRTESRLPFCQNPGAWNLKIRRGHNTLNNGIRALSDEGYTQTCVGWLGDLERADNSKKPLLYEQLTEDQKASLKKIIDETTICEGELNVQAVYLNSEQRQGHCEGYCKTTLWPLMHYLQWQDIPKSLDQPIARDYETYHEVNMIFAKKIAETWKPGDFVIIHDYHLLLVPQMLRQLVDDPFILLFLHCPFPSSEIFRCLPKRKEILDGMLGANVVSFQMYSYSRHFKSSCVRVCGYESTPYGVEHSGSMSFVSHCPIGIEPSAIIEGRDSPNVLPKVQALMKMFENKKILVGRDTLDEVKGVVQKMQAFQHLLRNYPEWRNKVVLVQVSTPTSHESSKLEATISELVLQINAEFGSLDYSPVHHYHRLIDTDEYFALFTAADVGLFTCIRDGMNTPSMEFVLCQETNGKSPMILSEFMGIAAILKEAIHVNPWNIASFAEAMNQALVMPQEEKEQRQAVLYQRVTHYTSKTWSTSLVRDMLTNLESGQMRTTHHLRLDSVLKKYQSATKRVLIFDYDGTLTPLVAHPENAVPSQKLLTCLPLLCADPKNIVFVISGRDMVFLDKHLGNIPNLGMSAEHGGFFKEPGSSNWLNMTAGLDMSWMADVMLIFQYYMERTTGSMIERKESSITWHYRNADPEFGAFQSKQCHDLLASSIADRKPVDILPGKKVLEVRPATINKGEIAKRVVSRNTDTDFILCAGDDKTDEEMFRALTALPNYPAALVGSPVVPPAAFSLNEVPNSPSFTVAPENLFTISVGPESKKTLAGWHVLNPDTIIDLIASFTAKENS